MEFDTKYLYSLCNCWYATRIVESTTRRGRLPAYEYKNPKAASNSYLQFA